MIFSVGAGVLSLLDLLLDLYFRAHAVLAEIAISREKGLKIRAARDTDACFTQLRHRLGAVDGNLLGIIKNAAP